MYGDYYEDEVDEEVSKFVLLVVIIHLCICGVIIIIAIVHICCFRINRVVIQQTIPPRYEPPEIQTMNLQPIIYQQPNTQIQYIPPPTQHNNQQNPLPY